MSRFVGKALVVLGFVGYQFLVHAGFHEGQGPILHLTLLLLPLLALAYWVIVRVRNKPFGFAILIAAGLAIYLMEHQVRLGLVAACGIPHAVAYLFLLWLFGRTLLAGREPFITRLARRAHGTLPADMELYTRQMTLIWALFFAAQLMTSALLYRFASLDTWSFFINLLNFPLVLLMFIGDYIYRLVRFRHHPQPSIFRAMQAFHQDSSFSKETLNNRSKRAVSEGRAVGYSEFP